MHPLSDKDLDRLSREAAEQYDVQQNTSGWDKLEQKLNKQLPVKGNKERRRFLFFMWLFALITGGTLGWVLTSDHAQRSVPYKAQLAIDKRPAPRDGDAGQGASIPKVIEADPLNTSGATATGSNVPAIKELPAASIEEKKKSATGQNRIVSKAPFISTVSKPDGSFRKGSARDPRVKVRTRKNLQSGPDNGAGFFPAGKTPASRSIQKDTGIPEADNRQSADIPPAATNLASGVVITDSVKTYVDSASTELVKTDSGTSVTIKKKAVAKNNFFNKGFEIGLAAAPDMSNVKFRSNDEPGFTYGIQLGYRFTTRFSVNTGVLYTRKNYTSRGKDFNPPKGSWLDNVALNSVEGDCFMFDVPVNIRYDLNTANKHRYFLSTGLSSYFMKKENYDYHYQYASGTPGYRSRSYTGGESHLFSILNISAGFEKSLSKRLSLQAEPYFKIPLQGVGYGNIQLNSYGMYFSLKFSR